MDWRKRVLNALLIYRSGCTVKGLVLFMCSGSYCTVQRSVRVSHTGWMNKLAIKNG